MAKATMTKAKMVEVLTDKGIEVNAKATKKEIEDILETNRKKLMMGNRTGTFYFGTRQGTLAGAVCEAIAYQRVKSTLDIRKQITTKYTFADTLKRLEIEGIIKRDGKSFELTQKGREVAAQYKARFNS